MKKLKKSLSLLMAVLMLLSLVPFSASAATITDPEDPDWSLDKTTGVLTISGPEVIPNYPLGSLSTPWYEYKSYIKKIVISDTVTTIGNHAFRAMPYEEVVLGKNVTEIGKYSFAGSNIKEMVLPDGIKVIGEHAFDNTSLKKINLPDSLEEIGEYAFYDSYLQSIKVPEGITEIPAFAFSNTELKTVELPSTLTKVKNNAFADNYLLESVEFADGADCQIGYRGFGGCLKLSYVDLGSVSFIERAAFYYCTALKYICIPDDAEVEVQAFTNAGIEHICLGHKSYISCHAFEGCDNIKTIAHHNGKFGYTKCTQHVYGDPDCMPAYPDNGIYFIGTEEERKNYVYEEEYAYYWSKSVAHPEHDYTEEILIEPTCTEPGRVLYTCYCGHRYLDKPALNPDNHADYSTEIRNRKEPTCNLKGYSGDTYCSGCEKIIKSGYSIPATGEHNYKYYNTITHATCTTDGSERQRCKNSGCGKIITVTVPAKGHSFTTKIDEESIEATCISTGLDVYKCNCGEVERTETPINSKNHTSNIEYRNGYSATCIIKGYEGDIHCKDCGKKISNGKYTPYSGHKNTTAMARVDSTCTSYGHEAGVYCNDCKTWIEGGKQIGYKSHNYGDWYIVKAATCKDKVDQKERKCKDCGFVSKQNFSNSNPGHVDDNHNGTCDVCTKKMTLLCLCACHKSNGRGTGWHRFCLFFWKLFKTKRVCQCGVTHY